MPAEDVSDDGDDSRRVWRKSSRSYGGGECVEVASYPKRVDVRDSKNPRGAVLRFTAAQWNYFVAGVRSDGPGL
ncbi:MAG: DUF397 domain-containing protein [Trebonia sp.]